MLIDWRDDDVSQECRPILNEIIGHVVSLSNDLHGFGMRRVPTDETALLQSAMMARMAWMLGKVVDHSELEALETMARVREGEIR